MDEATRKTLATDLAFQAVDLLGTRPMTIKHVLSLDDPDSITDFDRLKQILLMAYDAGRDAQQNSPLDCVIHNAQQGDHLVTVLAPNSRAACERAELAAENANTLLLTDIHINSHL